MAGIPPSPSSPLSPRWSSTTKMVVGLTIVAIVAAAFIQFRNLIAPLILAFMLAYLLHPVSERLSQAFNLSWRGSVNLIYLLLVVILVALFTLTGLAVVQQIQSLIGVVERFITDLPELIAGLSTRIFTFGPFTINLSQFDIPALTDQLLGAAQGMLGRITTIVSSFAASAASTLGWLLFIILISYFLLADAGRVEMIRVEVPGYNSDVQRLSLELKHIWNAFLRGQLIIMLLVIVAYSILMTVLGVRYGLGIAMLAGLARFVPYLGPLTVWVVMVLVTMLQGGNYFGLPAHYYAALVVILGVVLDQIFDNVISPRMLGQTLGVHPAAVLVAAIVATNLIGVVGLVLAAPVLASLKLLGRYILRKMFDMDPWPETDLFVQQAELPWARGVHRLRAWLRTTQRKKT